MAKKPRLPTAAELAAQTQAQLDARLDALAVMKLSWFVRRVWPVVEPDDPLEWGPHIDLVCEEIERQVFPREGDEDRQNLMLLLPPGSLKSWLTSVARPAWVWLHESSRRSWYISASDNLTKRDSRRTRMILESDTYKRLRALAEKMATPETPCSVCGRRSHPMWDFAEDQNEKQNFETTNRGSRWCMPFNARGSTGNRARDFVFDDLIDIKTFNEMTADAQKELLRSVNDGMAYIEATRATNLRKATRTLVMQRVADGDPADLRMKDGGWRIVCLPMEYDAEHPQRYSKDWRTAPGEWLLPGMFSEVERDYVTGRIGAHGYATQYQQRATAKEGGMVQAAWLSHEYAESPKEAARSCDAVELWVDTAVKGKEQNDDCAMLVVGRRGGDILLLDDLTGKKNWTATKEAYRHARQVKWPEIRVVVIEDKASGSQLKEEMDAAGFTGNVLVNPGRLSKAQRWDMHARPFFEGGSVRYPKGETWVEPHRSEVLAFTGRDGGKDNRIDCWSMGLWRVGRPQGIEVPASVAPPSFEAGMTQRWARRDSTRAFRMGVCVDYMHSGLTATWAVVVDADTGEQVAQVCVPEGGEGVGIIAVSEEAAYWNAVVRVGSLRAGLAHRFATSLARRRVRVACRDGELVDGDRAVWGKRHIPAIWGQVQKMATDRKLLLRGAALYGALVAVVPESGDIGPEAVATGLALTGMQEKSPKVAGGPKLTLLKTDDKATDLWERTSLRSAR